MNIEIQEIFKCYGKKRVLNGINISASSGECIGILGSNGCGKSTLLSILAGIISPDSGKFLYDGNDLFAFPRERAKLIGYVPQGTPLIEELTAKDNLSLWYSKKQMKEQLNGGILDMLGINGFLNTTVSKMSGGMKKRLSIGCAISQQPPILLLDEPMASLDIVCKQEIYKYINNHKKNGGIVILVTHDLMEIELCDKCYVIKNGTITPFLYTGDMYSLVNSL